MADASASQTFAGYPRTMSIDRCARCGRNRPVGLYDEDGAAGDNRSTMFGVSEAAWASFGGQDVCPQCQSPEERREAAQRLKAIIAREVERRQQAGVPPDPYETAIVNYALAIPDRPTADSAETGAAAKSATAGEPADRSEELHLRVSFTGAFLTGYPLAVRIGTYFELQRKLADTLTAPQWRTEGLGVQGGTYKSGGGFSEPVPLVIIRREGADLLPWLSLELADSRQAKGSPLGRYSALTAATPKSLAIDVYDLGVAVLAAEFDVVARAGADANDTARDVKKLAWLRSDGDGRSPLADVLRKSQG
jgi:hypothetical protein